MRRLLVLPLLLAGCQPPPPPPLTPLCLIAVRPKQPIDTIRIVLPEPVDPAAYAAGTSDAERFLFAQLYETLVRRDCSGTVLPGLATKWDRSSDTTWRLALRSDARYSDGSKVTAGEVAAALTAAAPPGWRVTAPGNDVAIRATAELLPGALSNPRYVIAKTGGAGGWPLSTAGTLSAIPGGVMLKREAGVTVFTWPAGADARDLLESGVDGVLTNQPAAVDFASTRGTFDAIPLPWSHSYVLAVPPGQNTAIAQGGRWREAVRGDARAAAGPFWWATAQCPAGAPASAPAAPAATPTRVVYPQGDSVARGLAERLVARGVPSAQALAPAELRTAVAGGADYAIVPLARNATNHCATLEAAGLAGWPAAALIALVDTRFQFIVRSGRFGVLLDENGTPRIQQ